MSKKVRIQTTIDKDVYEKIVQKYIPIYGSLNKVIENAIKIYDSLIESIGQEPSEKDILILKMVREIGVVLLSSGTINAGASGNLNKIVEENEVRILLEWYYKRSIDKISLDEFVKFIKVILPTMNLALSVEVQKIGKEVHVIVSSRMEKEFNKLLCEIIKDILEKHFNSFVDYSVFAQGFEIVIK
ncbi:MAG: hypothetical protein ACK401_08245 [Archaeoglobaceae archaeon]